MENRRNQYSEHHKVPTSRGGSNKPLNKENLRVSKHEAYHVLYENELPHEAIARIILENRSVFTDRFIQQARQLLMRPAEMIYNPEAFKSEKHIADLARNMKFHLKRLIENSFDDDHYDKSA